jgi:hypothetical protein
VRPTRWPLRKTNDVRWAVRLESVNFQSTGPLTLAEGTRSGSGGDACSTGGRPRECKRSKEAASQAKALERGARVFEVLAAAAQKRIKLAEIAMRIETETAVVNAAVEAFKLPL